MLHCDVNQSLPCHHGFSIITNLHNIYYIHIYILYVLTTRSYFAVNKTQWNIQFASTINHMCKIWLNFGYIKKQKNKEKEIIRPVHVKQPTVDFCLEVEDFKRIYVYTYPHIVVDNLFPWAPLWNRIVEGSGQTQRIER